MKKTHADLDSTPLPIRYLMHSPLQINIKQLNQTLSPNRVNPFNCQKRISVQSQFFLISTGKENYCREKAKDCPSILQIHTHACTYIKKLKAAAEDLLYIYISHNGYNIYNVVISSRKKCTVQYITHLQISYVRQKNHPEVESHPECLQTILFRA